MTLTDSHCHLPHLGHLNELEKILANAEAQEVTRFITIGTSLKENEKAIEVAGKYKEVYASVAIYPHEHIGEDINELVNKMEKQAYSSDKVVAIGECGIDLSNREKQRPLEEQIKLFEKQLELSQKMNFPVIIHNRNGDDYILKVLNQYKGIKGVVHCFDSTWDTAQKFLDLGFYISFSGMITYSSKQYLEETVRKTPSDKYLVETDSPYLLPETLRKEFKKNGVKSGNEPGYVRIVAQKAADIRQTSLEQVSSETTANAQTLFGLQ